MANLDKAFGERFKVAFDYASNQKIADKIGVSAPAVQNYKEGRIPDGEKLQMIATVTNCDLHWLLTGERRTITDNTKQEQEYIDSITEEDIEEYEYNATNVEPSEKFFLDVFKDTVVNIIRDTAPAIIENYLALDRGERLTRNSKVYVNKSLNSGKEFDVLASIKKYDNPNAVLIEWYKHEGITDLSADFGFIFSNWEDRSFEDKVETVILCKKLADKELKK